jgi:periplasmic glucans biosynthesis protein
VQVGKSDITRRGLMASVATLLISTSFRGSAFAQDNDIEKALAQIPAGGPFTRATVVDIARALSKAEFTPPPSELPDPIKDLTYEQYRDIRFNRNASIWADEKLPFQLQLFHRGFYYKEEIDIAIVDADQADHLEYSPGYFDVGKLIKDPMPTADIGFAGLRLLGHLNSQEKFDEIAAFLGASYFRSVGRDQVYGLSARGLALKTGDADGEEFPLFRAYWVEKPKSDSDSVVVHALLDSASVSGAYRFTIKPGDSMVMDVEAVLFPRVDLAKVGLAPGTSMFYFGANGREKVDDYRPEVHDSDGLLMVTGRGERVWRPLSNPTKLQISAFVDTAPRGFGLMQRDRDPETYQDFEANYERRPSLWVEPVGDWGEGAVALVEIPSDSEINDNIVAYWQPKQPIPAGSEYSFAYRLSWGGDPPPGPGVATVRATMRGRASLQGESPIRRFVVDYALAEPESPTAPLPKAKVTASAGEIAEISLQHNPLIGGWRLTFKLDPKDAEAIELRVDVEPEAAPAAETWLYRWTV